MDDQGFMREALKEARLALAQGEETCANYRRTQGTDTVILRFGHLYWVPQKGERGEDPCFRMCREALKTGKISANERRTFSMIYLNDAVEQIYRLICEEAPKHACYHISSGEETGEMELAKLVREELGSAFYLAMGVDACLAVYPQATWDRFTEKFASLPMSQSKAMRPLFANAAKCELDSQGRIVIPQKLRKYAGLDKDVVIIGVNDRAEIWSAAAWNAQEEEEMTPEKMAACMAELGF